MSDKGFNFLIIISFVAAFLIAAAVHFVSPPRDGENGCVKQDDNSWKGIVGSHLVNLRVVELKGHEYVIMAGNKKGSLVHAASCPCNSRTDFAGR